MATIENTITLRDNMRPVLQGVITSLNNTLHIMQTFDRVSDTTFLGMVRDVEVARNSLNSLQRTFLSLTGATTNMNNEIRRTSFSFVDLASKVYLIKNLLPTIGMGTDFIDSLTNIDNRLRLITGSAQELAQTNYEVFVSANRARAEYGAMAENVGKLGVLAGGIFKDNTEIIQFAELTEKIFKLSGASLMEQKAASYQLTQAMASGKLQGDEFRSIMENAPMLASYIAEYTGLSKAALRELSRDGLITSTIIKNSMFKAANDIENRFNTMSITIGQRFTVMKNVATYSFKPISDRLSTLLNTTEFNNVFNSILSGIVSITSVILTGLNMFIALGNSIIENWDIIGPFVNTAINSLKIYLVYLGIVQAMSIKTAITTGIAWATANAPLVAMMVVLGGLMAIWEDLNVVGKALAIMLGGVTAGILYMTYGVVGLSAAIKTNPIGLLVTGIAFAIYGIIKLVNYLMDLYKTNEKFAFAFIDAWEGVKAAFLTLLTPILVGFQYFQNMYIRLRDLIQGRKTDEIELWKFKNPWVEAEKMAAQKKALWKPTEISDKATDEMSKMNAGISRQIDSLDATLTKGKNKLGKDNIADLYEYNKNKAFRSIVNMGSQVRINVGKIEKTADADAILDKIGRQLVEVIDKTL